MCPASASVRRKDNCGGNGDYGSSQTIISSVSPDKHNTKTRRCFSSQPTVRHCALQGVKACSKRGKKHGAVGFGILEGVREAHMTRTKSPEKRGNLNILRGSVSLC